MGALVSSHNNRMLKKDNIPPAAGCNCKDGPNACPLTPPECQKDSVIYVASVDSPDGVEHYTGLTGGCKFVNVRPVRQ